MPVARMIQEAFGDNRTCIVDGVLWLSDERRADLGPDPLENVAQSREDDGIKFFTCGKPA